MRQFLKKVIDAYLSIRFHPMDRIVIFYNVMIALILMIFRKNYSEWTPLFFGHLLILILLPLLLFWQQRAKHPVLTCLRVLYPIALLPMAWNEMGKIVTIIFPFWMSAHALQWDQWLFGVMPTVWVQQFYSRPLTELMYFFYASYYFIVPIIAIPLLIQKRKEHIVNILTISLTAYTISYLLFLIFPTEGPRHIISHLHTIQPEGYLFTKFVFWMQSESGVRGAALPSSHVSAAASALLGCYHFHRKIFYVLLPLVSGMTLATVYCQYHHAIDAIAGLVVSAIAYILGMYWLKQSKPMNLDNAII